MAKNKLQLYVWEGFSPDYTSGLAFAIAESLEEAQEIIKKEMTYDPCIWGELSVHSVKESFGKAVAGGG
jgi:hypothetical protein